MSRTRAVLRRCLAACLVPLSACAAMSACTAINQFGSVEVARTALVGMTKEDLRMCAGFPNRTEDEGEVSIWSYEMTERSPGLSVSAPILFGVGGTTNLALPSSGSCYTQFRITRGRVDRLSYAGDNDGPRGRDSRCMPIVDGCLAYMQRYGPGQLPRTVPAPSAALGPEK